uniref:YDG domain-containing protein n=1 Tax=Aliarcobacter cryaerophilus TaxID=28198 RepID=UPI000AF00501
FAHGGKANISGTIDAKGGFVETSGREFEIKDATINAGHWLIDPINITINSALANIVSNSLNSGDVTISTNGSCPSGGICSGTDGDITLESKIDKTSTTNSTLTLKADRNIIFKNTAEVKSSNSKLNLVLIADNDSSNGGSIYLNGDSSVINIDTNGGDIWFGGNSWGKSNGSSLWNGLNVGTGFAASADNSGVWEGINLKNSSINTNGGNLYIAGRSGKYDKEDRYGVIIKGNTKINTKGGNIDIKGDLAQRTGSSMPQPKIYGVSIKDSSLETTTGNINIVGGEEDNDINHNSGGVGVHIYNSIIKTTGETAGNIDIKGTAGKDGGANFREGVKLEANGENKSTLISTVNGNINIDGKINNSVAHSIGLIFHTEKTSTNDSNNPIINVLSKGGNINLSGTGGNKGIYFDAYRYGKINIGKNGTDEYSGNINLKANSIINNAIHPNYLRIDGAGSLNIEAKDTSFVNTLNTTNWFIGSDFKDIIFGKYGNNSNILLANNPNAINANIKIYGKDINLANGLSAKNISLYSNNGNVTQGGSIEAEKISFIGGNITLNGNNNNNNVHTLVAKDVGSFSFIDEKDGLEIGSFDNIDGITSTGTLNIATKQGDIVLNKSITTTNSSSSAVILNSGKDSTAGEGLGGDIIINSGSDINIGTGGLAKLYTGRIENSLGISNLIGSGSGKFRYNSDETTTNFTSSLDSSGKYAIYREKPTVSLKADDKTITYGDGLNLSEKVISGVLANGDKSNISIVNRVNSTSGNIKVGEYTLNLDASNLTNLGYEVTNSGSGTLTVFQKELNITGMLISNKTYDGANSATISNSGNLNGVVGADSVNISNVFATFKDKNAQTNKEVNISQSLVGADKDNYIIKDSILYADINKAILTISGNTINNKTYDGTTTAEISIGSLSGLIGSEKLQVLGSGNFDSKNAGNRTVTVSYNLQDGENGGLANNYKLE